MGGALPGFGDQRNFELLIEAGFTPVEAIQIMTLNGAQDPRRRQAARLDHGRQARRPGGDPRRSRSRTPAEIRKVTIVFKDGVGYDSAKMLASSKGLVGIR